MAEADAVEKKAAEKELAGKVPVVPQLEQPKGPPIPEIPSSVSSPFAAAEKAAAEVAVAAEKTKAAAEVAVAAEKSNPILDILSGATPDNVKGNGDIVQGMADADAAAAAEMTKATEQARDELVDSLPPGTVTDAYGAVKVPEPDDVPNRVMTIGGKKLKRETEGGGQPGAYSTTPA